MEKHHGGYVISDDPTRLNPVAIHAYLSQSYWSPGIPLETVQNALKHSVAVGAYAADGTQIGLVRIITDFATYAYLCDVYVLEAHRSKGLAKAMMTFTLGLPRLQSPRNWNLRTRDAHPLYAQFGFKVIDNPDSYMVYRPGVVPG